MDRNAMHKLSYGIFVITTKSGEKDNGYISNTAIQAASVPNQISFACAKANYSHDMIMESMKANISVISEKASFDMIRRFGFASGRDTDKFEGFDGARRADNGILYVKEGTNSYFSVDITKTADLGSHTLFIGEPSEMEVLSDDPSATYDFYHSNIKPKSGTGKKGQVIWKCSVCGYEYEGEELPKGFTCPVCRNPASYFYKTVR